MTHDLSELRIGGKQLLEADPHRRLRLAISDPGAITPRGDNYAEPLLDWQARAVTLVQPQPDPNRAAWDKAFDDVMAERDSMHDALDKMALAVAPEEVIGEHSSGNSPWANAFELITPAAEVDALRKNVTETEQVSNGWRHQVEHLAAKRDLAEAVIAEWETGSLDPVQAMRMVKSALAVGDVKTRTQLGAS